MKRNKITFIFLKNNFHLDLFLTLLLTILFASCSKNYTPAEKAYIAKVEKDREEKNLVMKNDPDSPFNKKGKIEFHNLNYFDVDPAYVFKSKLFEYDPKDTIVIYGTKGEVRHAVKFGYVQVYFEGKEVKVNVYKGFTNSGMVYYSIWYTDKTTNNDTYGVGRYIDFEKVDNPEYIYTINFNSSYNPYCAYSPNYSCAVPTKEDYIPFEIKAGEKKFHK